MSELNTLAPDETVKIGDETIKVRPFRFTEFPTVIRVLTTYSNSIGSLDAVDATALAKLLLVDEGEGIFDLICLTTGKDRAWLDSLEADEGIRLLSKVIEMNLDFFNQRLTPALTELSERIGKTTGEKQLADSSKPDTASQKSKATPPRK